jgi:hypothetical protein
MDKGHMDDYLKKMKDAAEKVTPLSLLFNTLLQNAQMKGEISPSSFGITLNTLFTLFLWRSTNRIGVQKPSTDLGGSQCHARPCCCGSPQDDVPDVSEDQGGKSPHISLHYLLRYYSKGRGDFSFFLWGYSNVIIYTSLFG